MRYQAEHKQQTRDRVVEAASRAIREHGPDKISVAALMAKAGLTHGGFYAHFKSKDELVLTAIAHMFGEQRIKVRKWTKGVPAAEGLANYIDRYLSPLHRDHTGKGCPVAALSNDVGRMPAKTRKEFEKGLKLMIEELAEIIGALPRPNPESLATSTAAEMIGALAISRSVADTALSNGILEAARLSIKNRLGLN